MSIRGPFYENEVNKLTERGKIHPKYCLRPLNWIRLITMTYRKEKGLRQWSVFIFNME